MSIQNVRALKGILRNFELVAGLKVNFHKSGFLGIKANQNDVQHAANILNFKIGSLPFKFLGFMVGANPRRSSTWIPLIKSLEKRLWGWKNKFISFGGRVILINAVLSSLLVYYLSFYKAPEKVLNRIIQIQRSFLWGEGGARSVGKFVGYNKKQCAKKGRIGV